jgi:hypothetical protein
MGMKRQKLTCTPATERERGRVKEGREGRRESMGLNVNENREIREEGMRDDEYRGHVELVQRREKIVKKKKLCAK